MQPNFWHGLSAGMLTILLAWLTSQLVHPSGDTFWLGFIAGGVAVLLFWLAILLIYQLAFQFRVDETEAE